MPTCCTPPPLDFSRHSFPSGAFTYSHFCTCTGHDTYHHVQLVTPLTLHTSNNERDDEPYHFQPGREFKAIVLDPELVILFLTPADKMRVRRGAKHSDPLKPFINARTPDGGDVGVGLPSHANGWPHVATTCRCGHGCTH
jgi:hypothetical protein